MQDGSRKAIIAACFANLGIAATKFVGFLLTGSAHRSPDAPNARCRSRWVAR